jgi:hypothetical protein
MSNGNPQMPVELPSVEVLTANFVGVLINKAFGTLGLLPDQGKGQKIDLPQAKLAIDTISALCDMALPVIDENQKKEFKNILTTLRMHYVQKVNQ